jgi:hypothetical protein
MKRKFLLLFFCASLCAQEEEPRSESLWDYHPIHGGGNVIAIGQANVNPKHFPQNGKVRFNKANAFTYMLLPVSRTSYFFPRIEWNTFTLDWDKNPKFNQTHFHFIQFALTFMTIAIDKWRWIARGDYNIDVKHFAHPKKYSLISALFWGTHELHRKWHFHIGALGYTGFEGQMVYPIIGFDFSPNKKWMFQAVFPITYSIDYTFKPDWKISLKARPLKERFRTGPHEPQPRSVFSYSSVGAEINLHYEKFLRVEWEVYAGYNLGGDFYIKDQSGHNPLYTKVESAPYGGASLNWGF